MTTLLPPPVAKLQLVDFGRGVLEAVLVGWGSEEGLLQGGSWGSWSVYDAGAGWNGSVGWGREGEENLGQAQLVFRDCVFVVSAERWCLLVTVELG